MDNIIAGRLVGTEIHGFRTMGGSFAAKTPFFFSAFLVLYL